MRTLAAGFFVLSGCLLTIDDGLVDRKLGRDGSADGGSVDDASVDGASATCSGAALFCEDFEAGSLGKWTGDLSGFGKIAALVDDPARPGNQVLRVQSGAYGQDWSSFVEHAITVPSNGDLELSLRLFVVQSAGEILPFGIAFGAYQMAYRLGTPPLLCEQGNVQFTTYPIPASPLGKWSSLRLTIHRATGSADVTVDGDTVTVPGSGKLVGSASLTAATVTLRLGVFFAPPNASWSGYVDDVIVRVK
jgi:hypothetical protein